MRKEIESASLHTPEEFERECRVLSLLNYLEHPNILELLGSYTCKGFHNLLFPFAPIDLNQFLQTPNHSQFETESDYLLSLCDIASALAKLHDYSSQDLAVDLKGYHHDIKPGNILVRDGKFLLADFGLSNLKEEHEDSKTRYKSADGRYAAPECEDSDNNYHPGHIGRKSDIWSLGCVIAEIVTYMARGPSGIQEFNDRRKVRLSGSMTLLTYHAGNTPNQGVQSWLDELEKELGTTNFGPGLIQLVKDMLQIEPKLRPDAAAVTLRLRMLTMKAKFLTIESSYGNYIKMKKDLEALVERERFSMWGRELGLVETKLFVTSRHDEFANVNHFHDQTEKLTKITEVLQGESGAFPVEGGSRAVTLKLRMLNDDLASKLPQNIQVTLNDKLEQKMVAEDDLESLQELEGSFNGSPQYRRIGILAAVKYLHRICESPPTGTSQTAQLKNAFFKAQTIADHFEAGLLSAEQVGVNQAALVEKIKYEEHWVGKVGDELYKRIGAVSNLLRFAAETGNRMRVLSPIGYFHDPRNQCFALAFEPPCRSPGMPRDLKSSEGVDAKVITLRQLMDERRRNAISRPSLEARFQLVRQLTSAVSELHKARWLHKNISSFTIIFADDTGQENMKTLPSPYFIGFNHSRPDDPNSFSNEYEYRLEVMDYHHPYYIKRGDRIRFEIRFDIFSLGLVLLEIGLWKSINRMHRGKPGTPPQTALDILIEKHVPQLGFAMGGKYQSIVLQCLTGGKAPSQQKDDLVESIGSSQELVESIAACAI